MTYQFTRIEKTILIVLGMGAAVVAVVEPINLGRLPNGTALSSFGSDPQAVPPLRASIAIAKGGQQ